MATKAGYLTKQGGKIKTWKKRWCVLENGKIVYHKNEGGETMGEISLENCGNVRAVDSGGKKKDKGFCFTVQTPSRDYLFVAEQESEMKAWIDAIINARNKLRGVGQASTTPAPASAASSATARKLGAASNASDAERVTEDDFEKLRVVGQGSFGRVLQVKSKKTGQVLAMKVLKKKRVIEKNDFKSIATEKNILMKLSHPFLIKLHASFQTHDRLFFIMDFINGGELFFHMQNDRIFSAERVRFYAAEMILGIDYLHSMGVIYRDLKPENILITADGHICLTDFGISKDGLDCNDARTATFCGTPEYLAPEVLRGEKYGKEIDYWSLGTIVYEMLVGVPPFYSEDVQEMYRKIMTGEIDYSEITAKDTKDIIDAFLHRDPAKRLCDVRNIKQHPYFASIDWVKLERKEAKPPFIPEVKDVTDASNFEETFTSQPVNSLPSGSLELSSTVQEHFKDFSYVGQQFMKAE